MSAPTAARYTRARGIATIGAAIVAVAAAHPPCEDLACWTCWQVADVRAQLGPYLHTHTADRVAGCTPCDIADAARLDRLGDV